MKEEETSELDMAEYLRTINELRERTKGVRFDSVSHQALLKARTGPMTTMKS